MSDVFVPRLKFYSDGSMTVVSTPGPLNSNHITTPAAPFPRTEFPAEKLNAESAVSVVSPDRAALAETVDCGHDSDSESGRVRTAPEPGPGSSSRQVRFPPWFLHPRL